MTSVNCRSKCYMHQTIECIDSVGNGWLNVVPSKSYILVCQGMSGSGNVCKICLSLTIVNCSSSLIHPQQLMHTEYSDRFGKSFQKKP